MLGGHGELAQALRGSTLAAIDRSARAIHTKERAEEAPHPRAGHRRERRLAELCRGSSAFGLGPRHNIAHSRGNGACLTVLHGHKKNISIAGDQHAETAEKQRKTERRVGAARGQATREMRDTDEEGPRRLGAEARAGRRRPVPASTSRLHMLRRGRLLPVLARDRRPSIDLPAKPPALFCLNVPARTRSMNKLFSSRAGGSCDARRESAESLSPRSKRAPPHAAILARKGQTQTEPTARAG